jgi:hypothetical protein
MPLGGNCNVRRDVVPGLPTTWNMIVANVSTLVADANVGLFAANLNDPPPAAVVLRLVIGGSKNDETGVILATITS